MEETRYKILENKNCFITGATGGIGRNIAWKFAEKSCNLFLTSTNPKKLKELQEELYSSFPDKDIKIFWGAADLNDIQDVESVIVKTGQKLSSIDILVNCAGVFPVKTIFDSELEDYEKCFDINVRSVFLFCKAFSRDMKKKRWGRIVNIGSSSAYAGFKETSIYCASKHALLGLSRSLYAELKEYNIRVFSVSPGSVQTEMGKLVKNQDYNSFISPVEIADFIVFLVAPDSKMISEEIKLNRIIVQ